MYKVFAKDIEVIFTWEMESAPVQKTDLDDEFKELGNRSVLKISGDPNSDLYKMFQEHQSIVAAGGVVKNRLNDCLFIFRNGVWDLPKGKLERGESVAECAVREVEEECGVSKLKIRKELPSSYHTYTQKETDYLKRTYWYVMVSQDGSDDGFGGLEPQLEEGITEVRWMSKSAFLENCASNTYPSVLEVLNHLD